MGWLLLGAILWAATGLGVALWQRRRGHHLLVWALLGIAWGPVTYALAVDAERRMPTYREMSRTPVPGAGQVDVLIGVDGSARSVAAAQEALALLGDRCGRVTLATVIAREGGLDPSLGRAEATARLESFADELDRDGVGTVVVTGSPGPALAELAEEDGYDVVVIGAKGSGLSRRLLGSAAQQLIATSPTAVLVGGRSERDGEGGVGPGETLHPT
ncbi:MAG: universal stress protein [Actinomycetota bacterium]